MHCYMVIAVLSKYLLSNILSSSLRSIPQMLKINLRFLIKEESYIKILKYKIFSIDTIMILILLFMMLLIRMVPMERIYCNFVTSIGALLFGDGLPVKFWPYDFNHVLRIWNALLHCDKVASPYLMVSKKKEKFRYLLTFGCHIHVKRPGLRCKCFKEDTQ